MILLRSFLKKYIFDSNQYPEETAFETLNKHQKRYNTLLITDSNEPGETGLLLVYSLSLKSENGGYFNVVSLNKRYAILTKNADYEYSISISKTKPEDTQILNSAENFTNIQKHQMTAFWEKFSLNNFVFTPEDLKTKSKLKPA